MLSVYVSLEDLNEEFTVLYLATAMTRNCLRLSRGCYFDKNVGKPRTSVNYSNNLATGQDLCCHVLDVAL